MNGSELTFSSVCGCRVCCRRAERNEPAAAFLFSLPGACFVALPIDEVGLLSLPPTPIDGAPAHATSTAAPSAADAPRPSLAGVAEVLDFALQVVKRHLRAACLFKCTANCTAGGTRAHALRGTTAALPKPALYF